MTGKAMRSPNAKKLKTASTYRKICECGAENSWLYSTNGDGSSVQVCKRCHDVYPIGKQYQDAAVGVRLIALSMLSALFTPRTDEHST